MNRLALRINLIGPTSIGKSLLARLAREYFEQDLAQQMDIIGIGDMVRDRLDSDPEFFRLYGPTVAEGDLVPDRAICPMWDAAEARTTSDIITTEGFHRDPFQIGHAEARGCMSDLTFSIFLNASKSVCHARALDRIKRKGTGARLDEGKFEKRFDDYMKSVDSLRAAASRTKSPVLQINANRDLIEEVFPDLLADALVLWRQRDRLKAVTKTTCEETFSSPGQLNVNAAWIGGGAATAAT